METKKTNPYGMTLLSGENLVFDNAKSGNGFIRVIPIY